MWAALLRVAAPILGSAATRGAAATGGRFLSSQFGQRAAGAAVEGAAHGVANNLAQKENNGGE